MPEKHGGLPPGGASGIFMPDSMETGRPLARFPRDA
jgi:hypothetical protein